MPHVLDACAIIAFLRGEPGADVVESLLLRGPSECMAHAVNVCEVFYLILRSSDDTSALDAVHELVSIWVSVHEDMDSPFWQQVGRFKAVHGIPLADAFALALAGRAGADLVTSDHGDFDAIAGTGAFNINFIR